MVLLLKWFVSVDATTATTLVWPDSASPEVERKRNAALSKPPALRSADRLRTPRVRYVEHWDVI